MRAARTEERAETQRAGAGKGDGSSEPPPEETSGGNGSESLLRRRKVYPIGYRCVPWLPRIRRGSTSRSRACRAPRAPYASSSGSMISEGVGPASTSAPRRPPSTSTRPVVRLDDLLERRRGDGLRGIAARRGDDPRARPAPPGAPAARRLGRAHGAARRDRDGAGSPVRRVGVGRPRARGSGRPGRGLAVPSGRGAERAPPASPPWTRSSRSARSRRCVWSIVALVAYDDADTYFEVGAVITTLILLGRFLEARARRRSGSADPGSARARAPGGPGHSERR